jgi:heterodisulfide reductase subunit A-like polyferredoxin
VCGGIEAPKDIPETVIQAGAAAAAASALIQDSRFSAVHVEPAVEERPLTDEPRVGVFICHCGTNIAGVVDINTVVENAGRLPQVALATDFVFACATDTQQTLIDLIQTHDLNRIVVAACSPKTHEPLFQDTLRKAGLNPYLFELTSIRDQCAWVHGNTPDKATDKAVTLVRAGVARAVRLEPLHDHRYPVVKQGLVIGGGIGGMSAALAIADQGYAVHLVEKNDCLGGFARNLTMTLEGHSPARLIRYLEERLSHHPDITVHLNSELVAHAGQVGAFEGVIETHGETTSLAYGSVVAATGGQAYEPDEYLYGIDDRSLTQVEFARRMADDPVWAGQLQRVVMIQCVGSRTPDFPFCSRACCSAAVKNSIRLKALNPEVQVVILYRDMRTFGFKELYYLKARQAGVLFFRYIPEEQPLVYQDPNDRLVVDFTDRSSHQDFRIEPDLVVLSAGMRPHKAAGKLARLLKLPQTREGFFLEAHVKLRPVAFATPGIYLAGLAHSPRFIEETITMAQCAGQQALKVLSQDEMTTTAVIAEVNPDTCAACLVCVRTCPFGAPFINSEGVSEIPPAACMGCGICTSECPAGAIKLKHQTDDQILAKIDALLE